MYLVHNESRAQIAVVPYDPLCWFRSSESLHSFYLPLHEVVIQRM